MHLPRHTIESHAAVPLFHHASFCSPDPSSFTSSSADAFQDGSDQLSQPAVFSCANLNGFLVAQTDPLKLVANRSWSSSQGGLSHAVLVQHTSLLFLVGGGRVPRFAPNKVVLWDEAAEYTAKPSASTPRDPDSDDDELGSVASRRASTIFSAGSEFDAYGRRRQGSIGSFQQPDQPTEEESRSFSPVNSLRFSTSSLVNSDDLQQDDDDGERDPDINARRRSVQGENDDTMEHSIGASSLGIGRLQASHLSDTSDRAVDASALLGDESPDMSSSSYSHSIMASSANLADPFAEDDIRSLESSSPKATSHGLSSPSDSSIRRKMSSSPSTGRKLAEGTHAASSRQGLFLSQSPRSPGAGLVDSVSSMATTATDATAKSPAKILRGREVAELEFSEVVRGVYATSIHLTRPSRKRDSGKGKGRASMDAAYGKATDTQRICVVLVVLLASKAVIFELAPPSITLDMEGRKLSSTWRIQKRASVQTYKNPKGLASVAPRYPDSANDPNPQPGAIVAIPGRQKGHVQLLQLNLLSASPDGTMPIVSNATSSAGAASIIVAHDSSLAAITLSPNGRLLTTASSKGTLIRVWSNDLSGGSRSGEDRTSDSRTGTPPHAPGRTGFGTKLVRELRRGTDPATILSIAFAPDASLIAAASDKGTIHIFLLAETAVPPIQTNARESGTSSSSSTSRVSHLGRAAAQYLPTGIGSLAGQLPPSVLPQYLKSEWSSAQYRIPLKSFGASSRHYSKTTTTDDDGMYSGIGATGTPAGTEKSTEGAWAHMRSRISDLRKGEANVDEKVFLCWIVEGAASHNPAASTSVKAPKSVSQQGRADKPKTRVVGTASELKFSTTAQDDPRQRYRLIAVTTSGGWYKLAITLPQHAASSGDEVSGSTVLDMYRSDASIQSKRSKADKDTAMQCNLVEFRPMVALLDGWRV